VSVGNLSFEVLLEIFDFYRQTFQHEVNYERAWNSKKGWFTLAHVCQEWRRVVLTSPSRLYVWLLFTEHRTRRAIAPERLPLLPIIVDYSNGAWTAKAQRRMVSTLAFPNRVCGIAFRGNGTGLKRLFEAMNGPFSSLYNLELDLRDRKESKFPSSSSSIMTLLHPPPFLRDNPLPLRRLKYTGEAYPYPLLSQILSCTKSLVEIDVCVERLVFPGLPWSSPFAHLRTMPFLRSLKLQMCIPPISVYGVLIPKERGDVVLLPQLTSLRIIGLSRSVDALMAELATPALQEFHVSLHDNSSIPDIQRLCKFIRDAGIFYSAAQLKLSRTGLTISMLTPAHSIDDPPFNIIVTGPYSITQIGAELAAMVSTVEDVFLTVLDFNSITSSMSILRDHTSWFQFFARFRNVKILRIHHYVGMEVAGILRQGDVLPSLEEIEVSTGPPGMPISESKQESCLDRFKPFVITRQQMGRPVEVRWCADRVLPKYFRDDSSVSMLGVAFGR
jgi:hypothetical protein